ncbi:hypothetical protein [Polymorphospora sp. NPDC050346]|uniref:hypothetical protein n=1 Tax=Polymorphospora sp. NPDC050346 TaxID=3155780 RepID=UPI003411EF29
MSGTGGTADTCGTGYGSTRICIDYDGDYVFVYDGEADGGSGLAEIYSSSGSYDFRYCRNAHGAGTWARCNFDWPEDATKRVYGGVPYSYTNHPTSSELWHFTGAWFWIQ